MNLLLEGPDLEALLLRAHREGGTAAKIVRASKIRRGGFMGFFAREGFEVAVEIPDEVRRQALEAAAAGAAPGSAAAAAAALCLAGVSARAADTYDIDVVLPLTGGAAFLGKAEQQALQQ